jgi:hypothetical protein
MTTESVFETALFVYVPEGSENLFPDAPAKVQAASLDVLDRVASIPEGVRIATREAEVRYGSVGGRGAQVRVWHVVRDGLIAAGVIERTGTHIAGVRSQRYTLTDAWSDRPRVRVPGTVREPGDREGAAPVPGWGMSCLYAATFDLPAMLVAELTDAGVGEDKARELAGAPDYNAIVSAVRSAGGAELATTVSSRLTTLWRWRVDGRPWGFRDRSGLRLHTPITNLAKRWRRYLGFGPLTPDGIGGLVCIDAKNSQPGILAMLAARERPTADALHMQQVCAEGKFYEVTFHAVHGRWPTPAEREDWKETVMSTWLYADGVCQLKSREGKALAALWPTVHQWMLDQKLGCKRGDDGELTFNYTRDLPCKMQQAEAELWIDALIPRLEAERIPVFTVHDSAIVADVHAARTLEIIEELYAARGILASHDKKSLTA